MLSECYHFDFLFLASCAPDGFQLREVRLDTRLAMFTARKSEQSGHGAAGWCSQIQSLGALYEADTEMLQFLKSSQYICYSPAPAIQASH